MGEAVHDGLGNLLVPARAQGTLHPPGDLTKVVRDGNNVIVIPSRTLADYGNTGSAPAAPIVETTPLYSDDFNTYPDNTILIGGVPGWTAISKQGATTNEKFDPAVVGGKVLRRATGAVNDFAAYNGITTAGKYLVSPVDVGTQNQFVRFKAPIGTTVSMSVLATDEVNRLQFRVQSNTAILEAFQDTSLVQIMSLGGLTARRYPGGRTHASFSLPAVDDLWEIRVYNGRAYVARNKAPVGVAAGYAVGTPGAGTRVGFSTYNSQFFVGCDEVRAGPLAGNLIITSTTRKAYSRVKGLAGYAKGGASISWSGTYEGTITGLQWALVDPETGKQITDWARVSSATISGGNWSATAVVPAGLTTHADGTARDPTKLYRMLFRAENDTWVEVQDGEPFALCAGVAWVGQSNADFFGKNNGSGAIIDHPGGWWYHAVPPNTAYNPPVPASSWESFTTEGTALDMSIGSVTKILSEAIGLPVLIISSATAARSAPEVDPTRPDGDGPYIRATFANAGPFEMVYVSQGEAEINSLDTSGALAWKPQWKNINIPGYRALSGQPAGTVIPVFLALTGRSVDTTTSDPANIVRASQVELVSEVADMYLAHHMVGATMVDTFHFTQDANGYPRLGNRIATSMAYVHGASAYDGRGPLCGTPTRAGAVITIPISLNGASSLVVLDAQDGATAGSASALVGWEVSSSSAFSSTLTVSSVVLTGTNVVITLAADPGSAVWVRNYGGPNPTSSSWVFGSYTSGPMAGKSIGMMPIAKPVQTAS